MKTPIYMYMYVYVDMHNPLPFGGISHTQVGLQCVVPESLRFFHDVWSPWHDFCHTFALSLCERISDLWIYDVYIYIYNNII